MLAFISRITSEPGTQSLGNKVHTFQTANLFPVLRLSMHPEWSKRTSYVHNKILIKYKDKKYEGVVPALLQRALLLPIRRMCPSVLCSASQFMDKKFFFAVVSLRVARFVLLKHALTLKTPKWISLRRSSLCLWPTSTQFCLPPVFKHIPPLNTMIG